MHLIRDITEKHTLFSTNAKKVQLWYPFSRACKKYDLAPSVLNRAITDKQVNVHHERTRKEYTKCAIYRPDLEKVLPHLKGLITAQEAAQLLGVTKAQFALLQNSGCFKFEIPPRECYCSTWQYSRLELKSLIENINLGAACAAVLQIMQHQIQRRILKYRFYKVIKAIVAGQLVVRKPDNERYEIRDLFLDKAEFAALAGPTASQCGCSAGYGSRQDSRGQRGVWLPIGKSRVSESQNGFASCQTNISGSYPAI